MKALYKVCCCPKSHQTNTLSSAPQTPTLPDVSSLERTAVKGLWRLSYAVQVATTSYHRFPRPGRPVKRLLDRPKRRPLFKITGDSTVRCGHHREIKNVCVVNCIILLRFAHQGLRCLHASSGRNLLIQTLSCSTAALSKLFSHSSIGTKMVHATAPGCQVRIFIMPFQAMYNRSHYTRSIRSVNSGELSTQGMGIMSIIIQGSIKIQGLQMRHPRYPRFSAVHLVVEETLVQLFSLPQPAL